MILNEDLKKLSIIISKWRIGLDLISNKIPNKKKKNISKRTEKHGTQLGILILSFFQQFCRLKHS
jgi:hypothetical protein